MQPCISPQVCHRKGAGSIKLITGLCPRNVVFCHCQVSTFPFNRGFQGIYENVEKTYGRNFSLLPPDFPQIMSVFVSRGIKGQELNLELEGKELKQP